MQKVVVVAHLRNGSVQYLHRHDNSKLTPNRREAWRTSSVIAEDAVCRFHRVQAEGKHWQSVLFFDVCYLKA